MTPSGQIDLVADEAFSEPWQARLFAVTQAIIDAGAVDRETFRASLKSAIADEPDRPYWESWLAAVETLPV